MRKISLLAALLAFNGTAFAADLPVKAPPVRVIPATWTGCYIGVNIGGGWGQHTGDRGIINSGNSTLNAGIGVPAELDIGPSGVIGGGQVGCNYQTGQFVFGVETDIQGSGIRGNASIFFPSPNGGITDATLATGHEQLDWFGTVRARAGFTAMNNLLLYATGGLAYGKVSSSASLVLTPASDGNYAGSASGTKTGWTAGAGAEYAFARNWSVKVEYLYVDLGTTNVRMVDPGRPNTFIDYGFSHRENIVRAGLNFKFN
jgi:outer membrane immunogenic protein